jgi:hypothetical protein
MHLAKHSAEGVALVPEPDLAAGKTRQPIIAVDFDGVIAEYEGLTETSVIGAPRKDVIDALNQLRAEGWKIVVYSCRGAHEIHPYLKQNAVPFDEINPSPPNPTKGTKPRATVYWDDRACRYSGDALEDLQRIRNFRTWSGRR